LLMHHLGVVKETRLWQVTDDDISSNI